MNELSIQCPFEVGQVIEFNYPVCNELGVELSYERRRCAIRKIRDVVSEPLNKDTLRLSVVKRARFLIGGIDLDACEYRTFYVDSIGCVTTLVGPFYRVGVYSPDEPWTMPQFVGSILDDEEEIASYRDDLERRINGTGDAVGVYMWY